MTGLTVPADPGTTVADRSARDRVLGLSAAGVSLELGGRRVLDDVSVVVGPGELVVLVGPNGAGKSSLLGVLSGDLAPASGSVDLDGVPLASIPAARLAQQRSVQMQENRLAFAFATREVVEMGRAPWRRTSAARDDDLVVEEAMAATDVRDLAEQSFPTLSGGEKARTSFARVLAQRTPVILLDEPTAALDIRHQEATLVRARVCAHEGAAVVVVLHDLSLAAAYADRLVLLDRGAVRADGPARQVCDAQLLGDVYGHPVEVLDHPSGPLVIPARPRAKELYR
ncbi:heme ABC transporter ATP-binding protein [Pseudactinotalea suaedae]|uniref:heme ABC transporter ATP-binding protein n=1 Tax=Pseudactinotalea suaedae TaxID=1524924 RepID=UPI0012E29598|nr:heme ABC transporter ATP-binding protein [Pseudactinotalea suaedae]